MRNKRVFVSGGAGVIGTALVRRLIEEKADVFVGDLKSCPKAWWGKVKYRQGDLNTLTNQELIPFNPEIVFHLAATFERSEESYPFFEENFHHNLKLSHHLMHILKEVPALKRVVFASSYLIYDPSLYLFQDLPKEPAILTEDALIYPRNLCGAAKLFHESELRFLNHFLGAQMSGVSARIFRVYGQQSRDIISRWIRAALRGETLSLYRPEGRFDYIFADDVAEGLLKLAAIDAKGVVNLGSGQARSIAEVVQILLQYFPDLKVENKETFIPFEASQASIDRLLFLTNWQPVYTLETAIPKLIEFERAELIPFPINKFTFERVKVPGFTIVESRELSRSSNVSLFMGNGMSIHPKQSGCPAVLITSISKKVPLIEAVRRAANQLGQFQMIHGCDSDPLCIGQYEVDAFWHCPPLSEMTIEHLLAYCQENHITALIPTRDADLEFYAHHLSFLQEKGIQPMVSSLETVRICLDKKTFADTLLKNHFPAIPTFLSLNDDLFSASYVVKERKGAGSQRLGLDLNREKALKHGQSLKEPIFQPYIKGLEWSVDLYRSFEGRIKGCVARQRNQVVNGESQVTTTVHHPVLEHLCQEITEKLNIQGPAVFQLIEDDKGNFHVIECNLRFGGASTASIAVGWDVFFWFFIECLGLNLQDYPFLRCERDIRQIRYATDRILPWP